MSRDDPLDQPRPGEVIHASTFHVTLGHRQDERQVARSARLEKPTFERHHQLFGEPDPAEAADRNGVPVANQLYAVGCADELVAACVPRLR